MWICRFLTLFVVFDLYNCWHRLKNHLLDFGSPQIPTRSDASDLTRVCNVERWWRWCNYIKYSSDSQTFHKTLTTLVKSNSLKWNSACFLQPLHIPFYRNTTQQGIYTDPFILIISYLVCWLIISTLGCTNFEKFNHQTQRSNFPKWQGQMSTFPKVHSAPNTGSGSGSHWLWILPSLPRQTPDIRGHSRFFSYFIWCCVSFFCHQ